MKRFVLSDMDYFSSLPEPILCLIVSFLPFKEAARTSILSHKWLHIWRSTTNLQFHESLFVKSDDEARENQRTRFIEFIRHFIQNYTQSVIHQFELSFSNPQINLVLEMENFIRFATGRKVKSLDLDFSDPSWVVDGLDNQHRAFLEFKPSLCGNANELESLRLFSCGFKVLEFGNFYALKSISLGWIRMTSCWLYNLLEKCPLLESLSLKKCWDLGFVNVTSPRLQTLVIDKCLIDDQTGVRIDTNTLEFLKYSGEFCRFEIEYATNIAEAWIDFETEHCYRLEGELLHNLMMDLWCVRVLTVCSYMLQVIPSSEEQGLEQPSLPRVQHLILKTAMDAKEFYGITYFLHSCPCLEVLSFHLGPARLFNDYEPPFAMKEHPFFMRIPYMIVFKCLKSSLRVVEVKGYRGKRNEFCVLKYLLKYGCVLETLSITVAKEKGSDGVSMETIYRQQAQLLLQRPRASPYLNILIS